MMGVPKKSFLLYFDNYPMLVSLPPEQRGWVVTVLMVYADRVWRDDTVTVGEIMEQFPRLSPEARLVCGFMGGNVLRDTQRWLSRQQNQAVRRAQKEALPEHQPPRRPQREAVPDPNERIRADMERARRILEQSKNEAP